MGPRKLKTLLFFVAMAAILGAFILLSAYDQPPRMPSGKDHPRHALESSCVECHKAQGIKPLNKHHTERRSCLKCHKPPQ
jgi:hypothetical protein